jgi:hypothetical protein
MSAKLPNQNTKDISQSNFGTTRDKTCDYLLVTDEAQFLGRYQVKSYLRSFPENLFQGRIGNLGYLTVSMSLYMGPLKWSFGKNQRVKDIPWSE